MSDSIEFGVLSVIIVVNIAVGEIIMKSKVFVVLTVLLALLLGGAVGFGYWYNETFLKAQEQKVAELNAYYESAYAELSAKYDALLAEREGAAEELEQLKADYAVLQKNLENSEKTIADHNAQVEEALKAEEARVAALTEEVKAAEEEAKAYNEMVSYLRANNQEYEELYEELTTYLNKEKYTEKERDNLISLYEKMAAIQNEYLEKKAANDTTAAEGGIRQ